METTLRFAFGFFVLLAPFAIGLWIARRLLKNSVDPEALLFRWVLTAVVIVGGSIFLNWLVGPSAGAGEKIAAVLAGAVFGLILAIIWLPTLVDVVSNAFGSLYTGGGEPPPPQPYYSVAMTKRKQGKYREAIYAIQQELAKFPGDITGHMMLAQIQFEDMKDIEAAQLTFQRLCAHAGMPGPVIATSLNTLADWQLKLHNVDAAREALEEIIARLPDTEQSMLAQQRIAHLASRETLLASHEHRPIAMKEGLKDIGLMKGPKPDLAPQVDPAQRAEQLARHLEQHPADNEAREKLAMIYAEHYQRPDLALEQLEQLIAAPHQSGKEVARWLNVIADLQIQHGSDFEGARATLERVIELFPDLAAAQLAQQRIELLRLEAKGKEKSQVVKLGSYEKDIGLKQPPKRN
jgi:TolA-binding protein